MSPDPVQRPSRVRGRDNETVFLNFDKLIVVTINTTRVASIIRMFLADEVMYHFMDDESPTSIWLKLESRHM